MKMENERGVGGRGKVHTCRFWSTLPAAKVRRAFRAQKKKEKELPAIKCKVKSSGLVWKTKKKNWSYWRTRLTEIENHTGKQICFLEQVHTYTHLGTHTRARTQAQTRVFVGVTAQCCSLDSVPRLSWRKHNNNEASTCCVDGDDCLTFDSRTSEEKLLCCGWVNLPE